jgi:hypothetical protein
MAKCTAQSHRLNCSCCYPVKLDCMLEEGHISAHHCERPNDHLAIVWDYEAGWAAGTADYEEAVKVSNA